MGQNESVSEPIKTTAQPYLEGVSELHADLFFLSVKAPQTAPLKAYPQRAPQRAKSTAETPKKFMENRVKKIQLDEVSLGKWHLFEKIVGQNFGDDLSKREVLSAFRSFLKRVHPDLGAKSQSIDFAFLVKAKDELLAVIELDRP